jgi:thioesterase domain-containing protein
VAILALLDSVPGDYLAKQPAPTAAALRQYFQERLTSLGSAQEYESFLDEAVRIVVNHTALAKDFASPLYRGDAVFFNAVPNRDAVYGDLWGPYITGSLRQHDIESSHHDLINAEPAAEICRILGRAAAAQRRTREEQQ